LALQQRLVRYSKTARDLLKASVVRLDKSDQNVVVSIKHLHNQRPMLWLANHFSTIDKAMLVVARPDMTTYGLASQAKFHKNIRFLWQPQFDPKRVILITDNQPAVNNFFKLINIKYDYLPTVQLPDSSHLVMPFTMHPHTYFYEPSPIPLDQYRLTKRKYAVLFVGNSVPAYATKSIIEDCKILDRHSIIDHLVQNPLFFSRVSQTIEWNQNLDAISIPEDKRYVILVSVRIWQENWLKTLAESNFALCPPGVTFPLGHNLVESMSVGTIPILNYKDWLFPRLQDGINCLAFRTLDELDQKIGAIAQMSEDKIATMRQAVIDYYDQYLDPRKFASRLLADDERVLTLHMLDEYDEYVRTAMNARSA